MNFAAVVGASLRSGSALLRDTPTTAYYNVNRQRLHLSRAKHCLDEASHLSAMCGKPDFRKLAAKLL